jgi:hypothetical protein
MQHIITCQMEDQIKVVTCISLGSTRFMPALSFLPAAAAAAAAVLGAPPLAALFASCASGPAVRSYALSTFFKYFRSR